MKNQKPDRLKAKSEIRGKIAEKLKDGHRAERTVSSLSRIVSEMHRDLNQQAETLDLQRRVLFSDVGFDTADNMALNIAKAVFLEALEKTKLFIDSKSYESSNDIELHIKMPELHHTQRITQNAVMESTRSKEKTYSIDRHELKLFPLENFDKNIEEAMRRRCDLIENYSIEFLFWLETQTEERAAIRKKQSAIKKAAKI